MKTEKPLVSCIITTFGRDFSVIKRSINSALTQDYKNLEIILVDDNGQGSEMQKSIAKSVEKLKIKYIPLTKNSGAQVARNTGIKNSTGELVAFLDDDDEWMKEKISEQVKLFLKNMDAGLIYSKGYIKDEDTGKMRPYFDDAKYRQDVTYVDMLGDDKVGTTTQAMVPRAVFEKVGMFDLALPARQDYEMWLRISEQYSIRFVDKKLFVHYIHEGEQISKKPSKAIRGYKIIYQKNKKAYLNHPRQRFQLLRALKHNYKLQGNVLGVLWTDVRKVICALQMLLVKS